MELKTKKTTWQFVALLLLACSDCFAQDVQFARQRGPYYVGEAVLVQIIASGFEDSDEVNCKLVGGITRGVDNPWAATWTILQKFRAMD